jgi:hypothetical protein
MTLPPITKQQQAILTLIYYYRFLNRIQIQAFLRHKNKKTINTWLPDLVEKDYLKRIYSKGFSENTKPAIYYMGANGIRFMKALGVPVAEIRNRYKESIRTDAFIQQQLLLADIALSFTAKKERTALLTCVFTETQILSNDLESEFHFLSELKPNLVFVSEKEEETTTYMLDVFSPTLPKHSIRKRIRTYIEFFESGTWESNSEHPFPIILLVCPDKPALIYLKRYFKKLKEEQQVSDDLQLWFAVEEWVREQGVMSEIWEEV